MRQDTASLIRRPKTDVTWSRSLLPNRYQKYSPADREAVSLRLAHSSGTHLLLAGHATWPCHRNPHQFSLAAFQYHHLSVKITSQGT